MPYGCVGTIANVINSSSSQEKRRKPQFGEMLGHSNSVVTEHYLATMDAEKTFGINDVLC